MYYIYGQSGPSLLIESTDSMIGGDILLTFCISLRVSFNGERSTNCCIILLKRLGCIIDNREGGGIGNAYAHIRSLAAHARHGTPP